MWCCMQHATFLILSCASARDVRADPVGSCDACIFFSFLLSYPRYLPEFYLISLKWTRKSRPLSTEQFFLPFLLAQFSPFDCWGIYSPRKQKMLTFSCLYLFIVATMDNTTVIVSISLYMFVCLDKAMLKQACPELLLWPPGHALILFDEMPSFALSPYTVRSWPRGGGVGERGCGKEEER